jgi:hypothetical protein
VEFNALKLEIINLFGDQIRQSWKTPETQALVKNYLCETGALTELGRQTFKCDSSSGSGSSSNESGSSSNESGSSSSESESGEGMQQDYGEVI